MSDKWVADFETCPVNVENSEARVWASCVMDIETREVLHLGHDISEFIDFIYSEKATIYFHNLKFDGKFIIPYLLQKGFKQLSHEDSSKFRYKKRHFECIIDEMGNYYGINIYWGFNVVIDRKKKKKTKKWVKTSILDSYKLLPYKASVIADKFLGFKGEDGKGKLDDYNRIRPKGYIMNEEEKNYIIKDCEIISLALNDMFNSGLTKSTVSSNAFNQFLKIKFNGKKQGYRDMLPELDKKTDDFIRESYKGGWTYVNPKFLNIRNKKVSGTTFDVNSLYPSVMYKYPMPYGTPEEFEGKYIEDKEHPLYIQKIHITRFKLRKNKFPMIQIKNNSRFTDTEYLTEGENVYLTVTNIDLQLIKECYLLAGVTYIKGLKFRACNNLFKEYIDKYIQQKIMAGKLGNGALREQAKLMLNSLYGKFGSKVIRTPIELFLNNKEILSQKKNEDDEYAVNPYYTALSSFITAYARRETITGANNNYDSFMYADTDSLHLNIDKDDIKNLKLNIDWNNSGDLMLWKIELFFDDSLYLGAKKYMEHDPIKDVWEVKCAGLPYDAKKLIKSKEQFYVGATFEGKNAQKTVKNGVLILPAPFSIKK